MPTLLAGATWDNTGHVGAGSPTRPPGTCLTSADCRATVPAVAFTKSPYKLSRAQSLRVEDGFPAKLAAASKRAGVPNGVLLGRLVDQYLESEADAELSAIAKVAEARAHVHALVRLFGIDPALIDQAAKAVMSIDEARAAAGMTDLSPRSFSMLESDTDESSTDTGEEFWNATGTEGD